MASAARTVQKILMQAHSSVYRATGGKVAGRLFRSPVLLLNTTGRKSGMERTTPLLYLQDGEDIVIVASNGGAKQHPAWYLNVRERPEASVEIGDRKLHVRAEQASTEEKERLWPKLVAMYSGYENYQRRTERDIPVIILRLVNG